MNKTVKAKQHIIRKSRGKSAQELLGLIPPEELERIKKEKEARQNPKRSTPDKKTEPESKKTPESTKKEKKKKDKKRKRKADDSKTPPSKKRKKKVKDLDTPVKNGLPVK